MFLVLLVAGLLDNCRNGICRIEARPVRNAIKVVRERDRKPVRNLLRGLHPRKGC